MSADVLHQAACCEMHAHTPPDCCYYDCLGCAQDQVEKIAAEEAWKKIMPGDILRHRMRGEAYIVVRSDYPAEGLPRHTVVRAELATNPDEWEKV